MAATILDLNSDRNPEPGADQDDQVLASALREGSEDAYETLLSRFQQHVYALALRLLRLRRPSLVRLHPQRRRSR